MKNLIIYFSHKGQTYCNGLIKNFEKGNTLVAAEFIKEAVGDDLFEIETKNEYPEDHYALIDVARHELKNNERPEVKTYLDNIDGYDNIFLGYPNWWGSMPMVLFTFLERYSWKDKRIIPFCTHEGGGLGASIRDIRSICTNAFIEEGFSIIGYKTKESEEEIKKWAKEMVTKGE